ncbi:hypothetical protein [Vibrio coralliilyticus]|uniref:hypothetical protein n=1 Tax=Vibrio coralliilyticus TaxID=190893 RepID=UPI00117D7333|nr:hypothetical protein [Vibrio coralliilyticus]NOI58179.1 hypothetical protein [Vibrio coralliilyticus]
MFAILRVLMLSVFVYGCASSDYAQKSAQINEPQNPTPQKNGQESAPLTPNPISASGHDVDIFLNTVRFIDTSKSVNEQNERIPLNGLYTKLLIYTAYDNDTCSQDKSCVIKDLEYKKRWGLTRFFFPKRVTLNASAKVDLGVYKTTVSLLSIDETSSSEVGSRWERYIIDDHTTEPLFLVPQNITHATLDYSFTGNEDTSFSSAKALDIAIGAVSIVSPTSSLITSLNKQSVSDKSAAIDKAIANAFSESLIETKTLGLRMDSWSVGDTYTLKMKLPKDEKTDWEAEKLATVGIWSVRFDAPRISAIYPYHVCGKDSSGQPNVIKGKNCFESYAQAKEAVFGEFKRNRDYHRVLDTELYKLNDSNKVSVSSLIGELPSVKRLNDKTYLTAFASGSLNRDGIQDMNTACADISREMTKLGLSVVDTSLVIYSTFLSSSLVKLDANAWETNLAMMKSCDLSAGELKATTI